MASPEENQKARDYLHRHVKPNTKDIEASVYNALADAYVAGKFVSADSLLESITTGTLDGESIEDYWNTWAPGNVEASDLLKDKGFQALLRAAGISVKGISDTTLDQMGTLLAEGADRGDSIDTIAGSLLDLIDNPDRAYLIANTEINRAVSDSSLDTFREMGLTQWEWLVSDGACPECQEMADSGPIDLSDDADQPPLHPGCRCAVSPLSALSESNVDDSEDQTLD